MTPAPHMLFHSRLNEALLSFLNNVQIYNSCFTPVPLPTLSLILLPFVYFDKVVVSTFKQSAYY